MHVPCPIHQLRLRQKTPINAAATVATAPRTGLSQFHNVELSLGSVPGSFKFATWLFDIWAIGWINRRFLDLRAFAGLHLRFDRWVIAWVHPSCIETALYFVRTHALAPDESRFARRGVELTNALTRPVFKPALARTAADVGRPRALVRYNRHRARVHRCFEAGALNVPAGFPFDSHLGTYAGHVYANNEIEVKQQTHIELRE